MKKPHNPLKNLGNFAHPPKVQTRSNSPKLIGKAGTGKKGKA